MQKSESIAKLSEALSLAQGKITGALKDASNPYFRSQYADLQSVWDAIREPLSSNGLAVIQLPGRDEKGLFVETILSHSSGEWISGLLTMTPVKDDPQGIGSAITYARRYALQAIAGVAPMDDDAEDAMGRTHKKNDHAIEERQESREQEAELKGWRDAEWVAARKAEQAGLSRKLDPVCGTFNGPKHKELAECFVWETPEISQEDFMAAMKSVRQIPDDAKSFSAMSDETAQKFIDHWQDVKEVVRVYLAKKETPAS